MFDYLTGISFLIYICIYNCCRSIDVQSRKVRLRWNTDNIVNRLQKTFLIGLWHYYKISCLKSKSTGISESSHGNNMWPLHFFIYTILRFMTLLADNGEKYSCGNNDLGL